MTRQLERPARRLAVSVADRVEDWAEASWTDRPDLSARVAGRSGSTPATCLLFARHDPGDDGPDHRALPGEQGTERRADGLDGDIILPFGLKPWSLVRVQAAPDGGGSTRTCFIGAVTGQRWDHQACRIEVAARDARILLRRLKCRGAYCYDPYRATTPFIEDWGPHFNAGNLPDQYAGADGARSPHFFVPGYNRDAAGQVDEGFEFAEFWTPGDALNCLRDLYFSSTPDELDPVSGFLEWPEARRDGSFPWLFADPETGAERRLMDLDCCGRDLGWCLDQIVAAAGFYDWTLAYEGNKARILVYPVTNSANPDGSLTLGTLGGPLQGDPPDAYDCGLEWDWSESYWKVRAVGARKRVDLTLELVPHAEDPAPAVDASSTLFPLWTADSQAAWRALWDANPANPEVNGLAYQDVLLSFGAADDLDLTAFGIDRYVAGRRRTLAQLATEILSAAEAAARPVRLSIRVWRRKGETWELLPGAVGVQPLDERIGLRLAPTARMAVARDPGAEAETWSWHDDEGARLYPLRVTLSIEADERVKQAVTQDDLNDRWPAGELYLPAGERYQYNVQRRCYLRAAEDGGLWVPVAEGGTDYQFGAAANEAVRDDQPELWDLAHRRLQQVARPKVRGPIVLLGLHPEYAPGYVLGQISGAGRPTVDLYLAVREVELDDERQTTTLRLEAV